MCAFRGGVSLPAFCHRMRLGQDHCDHRSWLFASGQDVRGLLATFAVVLLQRLTFFQSLKERLEPDVPGTTLVNDGSIFAALALW